MRSGILQTLTAAQSYRSRCADARSATPAITRFGPGPNPNALAYFNSMPAANGTLDLGDGYNTGSYSFSSPAPVQPEHRRSQDSTTCPTRGIASLCAAICRKTPPLEAEQFPGQGRPRRTRETTARALLPATPGPSPQRLVNDIRYGYIRQGYSNTRRRHGRLRRLPLHSTPRPRKPAPPSPASRSTTSSTTSAGPRATTAFSSAATGA